MNAAPPNARPTTEAIWHHFGDRVHGFFRNRGADPQLAEDLTQDTFLRIHQGLAGLKDDQRLAPWIFRIAGNLLIDQRRQARPTAALDETTQAAPPSADDFNTEVGRWLTAMIDQLPSPYRRAVRLAELAGLPQKQIAAQLGLSLSGAKTRIQRGRRLLHQMLLRCCHLHLDQRGNIIDYAPRPNRTCCTD